MKMATTNYTLRIDENDKRRAEQVFKGLGMSFATGINIYLKAVGRQQGLPFELQLANNSDAHSTNINRANAKVSKEEKEQAIMALDGILAGHEIDLDKDRQERILSK